MKSKDGDSYLKIDIHNHILPKDIPNFKQKFGYGGFIHLDHQPNCAKMVKDDVFFREVQSNCWDSKTIIEECDSSGIDIQVLLTVPVMFSYWAKPEDALEVSRFKPDKLINSINFPNEINKKLFESNALAWLGLPEENFY